MVERRAPRSAAGSHGKSRYVTTNRPSRGRSATAFWFGETAPLLLVGQLAAKDGERRVRVRAGWVRHPDSHPAFEAGCAGVQQHCPQLPDGGELARIAV